MKERSADPIIAAEELLAEMQLVRPIRERGAWAVDHQREMQECLENLIAYIRGFQAGAIADQQRLTSVASALLSQVYKLQEAMRTRERLGMSENNQERFTKDWIRFAAPRLWEAAEKLKEVLQP